MPQAKNEAELTPPRVRDARPSRARKWLSWIFLATGVVCLAVWGVSQLAPVVWQAWANRALDRAIKNAPPKSSQAQQPAPLETGRLIGRLSIPRLNVSDVVREGDDDTTLSLALGHIPGTALPGEKGNVGVAGHRDSFFRPLREIRKDDLIRIETVSGALVYRVDSTSIVKPDDVKVLDPKPAPSLTLVTCYPFYYVGSAPERFIVSAHQVSKTNGAQEAAQAAPTAPFIQPASLKTAVHETPPTSPTSFEIAKGTEREIAPGISLGISDVDAANSLVYGWLFLKHEGRSVIVRAQQAYAPLVFYDQGRRFDLRFTGVSNYAATVRLLSTN